MHIGRAHQPPPDLQHAVQARVEMDLRQANPVVVARDSVPTGESGDPTPTYHPVTDLLQRQTAFLHQAPPPAVHEAYGGTPPAPSVIDLRA